MKTIRFLTTVLIGLLCAGLTACSDDSEDSMQYRVIKDGKMTVKLEKAGSLPSFISVADADKVHSLSLIGNINGADICFIRELDSLNTLDLSKANIVSGGTPYLSDFTTTDKVIGSDMFSGMKRLESVKIPNNITSIEKSAFSGCSGLTSVTIPGSVSSMGSNPFMNCTNLKEIIVSEKNKNYTDIDGILLNKEQTILLAYPCAKSDTCIIPNSVDSIGSYAFSGCSQLKAIYVNRAIPPWAGVDPFNGINMTKCILDVPKGSYATYWLASGWRNFSIIQDGNTNISNEPPAIHVQQAGTLSSYIPMSKKNQITKLTITGNLNGTDIRFIREMAEKEYGGSSNSGKLSVLDISGANIVKGGDYYHYYSFNSLYTSDNSIGNYMFFECKLLTSIIIPNNVTSIGEFAFSGCNKLTSISIPKSVTSIGKNVFSGCSELSSVTIGSGVTSIDEYAFSGCNKLTSITIPYSVTSIGDNAFSGCSGLTSVSIPGSVISMGEYVFSDCSQLTTVTIGNRVSSIGSFAFFGCSALTTVTIGSDVTSIGGYAFSGCSALATVTMGPCVTSIGGYAFSDCRSLTSITIPNCIASIEQWAFYKCTGLKEIHNKKAKPVYIFSEVFSEVDMTTCTLYVPKGSSTSYSRAPGWRYFKNIVEED